MNDTRVGDTLADVFDVRGHVVLVTGAASGLGRSIAEGLAGCGAHVVAADIQDAPGEGAVEPVTVDVRDADAMDRLVDGIVENHGRLDAVFANAGIARGRGLTDESGYLEAFDMADWRALLDVNLHGVVHTVRSAARVMKRRASGSIVVTASTAGLRADPFVSYSYVVAKAGVVNLVHQAALDLARWGIRVNAIAPGPFRTNIGGGPPEPAAEKTWGSAVPLGRMGDPTEIRGLAILLASRASSFMTGGVYPVDGGALLQSYSLEQLTEARRVPPG
ncbi:MAG TPA: SDR family oxidoreductase [Pseudonocardiaceae bacterium]|nr:SDR family oxidoreductase [Pseudonocardiaceae bacterium]